MIDVAIQAEAWTEALPDVETIVIRAAEAALLISRREAGGGDHAQQGEGGVPPHAPSITSRHLPRFAAEDPLVAVLLANDDMVAGLNQRFRGKAGPTNVLSFPAPPNPEGQIGDIALAYGVCAREAAEQGKSLQDHLSHLSVHGVLHLLGYDHETDSEAEAMEALERSILETLGVSDPYASERV
jgi:probable rRNA maturation factor